MFRIDRARITTTALSLLISFVGAPSHALASPSEHPVGPAQPVSHFRSATPTERSRAHLRPGRGPCLGFFEPESEDANDPNKTCTHGPDFYDGGTAFASDTTVSASSTTGPSGTSIPCYSTGPFVHVFYIYGSTSYLDAARPNARRPLIREAIALADKLFSDAAKVGGATRHPRWRMSSTCKLVITPYKTDPTQDIFSLRRRLMSAGKLSSSEKGLAYLEADPYSCHGQGELYIDDRSSSTNPNNHGGMLAELSRACLNDGSTVVPSAEVSAHELLHTLGAVQNSAPHSTKAGHCTDEYDVMCYVDDSGRSMTHPCIKLSPEPIDCGKNDYFRSNPSSGSYLATHWNTSNSRFLSHSTSSKSDALDRPTVSLALSPSSTTVEGTLTLTATASAPTGATLRQVNFYNGTTLLGSDFASPYAMTLDTRYDGFSGFRQGTSLSLTAKAIDTYYRTKTSSARVVSVVNPTVRLSAPGTNQVVFGLQQPWSATASAPSAQTVASVALYANNVLVDTASASPFEGTFDASTYYDGQSLQLAIVVTDSAGVTRRSPDRTVHVSKPTIRLVTPTGYGPSATGPTTLAAEATAPIGGSIASVRFTVAGSTVGTDITAPYALVWDPSGASSPATIAAIATDSQGGTATTSADVSISAKNDAVVLNQPTTGATVSGSSVALAATPTVTSGFTLDSVDFYLDGSWIGAGTDNLDGTYSTTWDSSNISNGTHVISASVYTDDTNNYFTTYSQGTVVVVNNPQLQAAITGPTASPAVLTGSRTISASIAPVAGHTVDAVDFYANGTWIGQSTSASSPSVAWNTLTFADGPVLVYALVSATGPGWSSYQTTSPLRTVSLGNVAARVTAPTVGATVGGTTTLTATATKDAGALIEWVRFYVDGAYVGRDGTSSYTLAWNSKTVSDGTHTIVATVYTSDGRSAASPAVSFNVNN